MPTVYAYLRVSTTDQNCANQRVGIDALANRLGLTVTHYIVDDGISGTTDPKTRRLGRLLRQIHAGDILLCSEVSRLGRNLFMIMDILNTLLKKDVTLYTVKDRYELGNNIQSKVLAFAFGLVAEIERDLISQRTREALSRIKAQGKHLGRPYGAKTINHKLDPYYDRIVRWRGLGWPKSKIAKRCHVWDKTLRRYMTSHNIA